jgi:hypothetical protein
MKLRFLAPSILGCLLIILTCFATAFSQGSNTCYFVQGQKAGATQAFPGFPPIPLGAPCNDGSGSRGFAVADGQSQPIGRFSMANGQPACVDIIQVPVPYKANDAIPKSGLATFDQFGRPVIFIKQSQISTFSPPVRNFLFAHECGHHALGQVRAGVLFGLFIGPPLELAADCFAMSELRRLNSVDASSIDNILQFLSTVPGDPTTFPGPQRVQRLTQCMASTTALKAETVPLPLPASNAIASPAPNKLEAFFSFVGINHGDTIDDVREKFGAPEDRRTSEGRTGTITHLFYFDSGLDFTVDAQSGKVRAISVSGEETVKAIRDKGIVEQNLDYIGKHKSKVVATFGGPKSGSVLTEN